MSFDQKQQLILNGLEVMNNGITISDFCNAVQVSERSFFLWKREVQKSVVAKRGRKTPPKNKLFPTEVNEVIKILLRKDWADYSPREIYYKLLDDGRIIASVSTFYRVARRENLLTKRVKLGVKKPLNREKPHLVATGPNQVWSWDVTQIKSDIRSQRFYLFVIMDIWSRLVVGWKVSTHEKTDVAIQLWKEALESQFISGKGLVNHKDNGAIMTSSEMIKFVHDAEMIDSYSRAGVSDDNPFSESLFATIKMFRTFPGFFVSEEAANEYLINYFKDYNYTYRHSRIQFITPGERHYGEEKKILDQRNVVIQDFYKKNEHRYAKAAKVYVPIVEVKIN